MSDTREGGLSTPRSEAFGGIDVVVNNAGGSMPQGFMDTSVRAFEKAFHFNVTTAFRLTQLAVPHARRENASVVNISSAIGRMSDRGFAAYGTAKGALTHLTRLMASDLAPRIRANGIAVGSSPPRPSRSSSTPRRSTTRWSRAPPSSASATPPTSPPPPSGSPPTRGLWVTGKVVEVDGGLEAPNLAMGLPDL